MKKHGVEAIAGCSYTKIDDGGLHYRINDVDRVAEVDTVIVCAGQEPARALAEELKARGIIADLIGGARVASELDAVRAIDEGTRLALSF